ncbi:hypothetical protein DH2020_030229 [Rehmannia glutinosa]|uniref:F-box domain-containing protein n=1 Tax=Rehmannia glutinosa TaxID=99300 RepID=A0ABR0VPJ0_REHGL
MDSSAERVESIDDILMEILIRLPEKSIFRFMSVSKRWTNIITNPFFLKTLSRRRCRGGGRLLALIERNFFPVPWFKPLPRWPPPMNILPVIDDDHRTSICKYVPKLLGYFINSSNGLILCGRHPYQYHVLNPVSRKWVTLPPPSPVALDGYERKSVGLMCEENTSELVADYTVVIAAAHADDNTMRIESYSSKTGKWVVKKLAADSLGLLKLCQPPEVANGIFHWKSALHFGVIGVYDPRLDENHVQLLELPKDVVMNENFVSRTITRSPVDDALWYGFITRDNLQFFRLNGYSRSSGYSSTTTIPGTEWVLMHSVSIDWLRKEAGVPPGVQVERKDPRKTKKISLASFIPWNPLVAVLRQGPRVFLYNLETKSIQWLKFHGGLQYYGCDREPVCPYIEPYSEDASPRQSDSPKVPTSGESFGSGPQSSSSKGENDSHIVVDSEIRWEDLQLREEIGQGNYMHVRKLGFTIKGFTIAPFRLIWSSVSWSLEWIGWGFLHGEKDRNMPLKYSTETKMGCQERRGGRMGSWSDLVWIIHGR